MRKLKKWIRPTKYLPARYIEGIEATDKFETSTCIKVAADDCLYVTRHHVVTHNTVITLTTVIDRQRAGHVRKTLIFGPLRVIAYVWLREARKWMHTQNLRFSIMHGSPEKRLRALFTDADIYLINYENMNWLAETLDHYFISQGKPLPFQMAVYDEISKLKDSTSLRMAGGNRDRKTGNGEYYKRHFTGWRKMIPHIPFTTGLTGTPASNGYLDLHGQYLAVDGGKRLGEYITHFRNDYFSSDYMGWKYAVTPIGKEHIEKRISDITIKMDAADYLDMPEVKTVDMMVELPPKIRKYYQELEKELFTRLDSGNELELFTRSSLSNKLLQVVNGSPYLSADSDEFETLHHAKLDALEDVIEEASGSPVLCSYSFKSDAVGIMRKFKKLKPINMTETKANQTNKIINQWNDGKVRLLIGHPASMGHGVDGLQDSGSIITWFGLNWSLELVEQMNGRINRNGQTKTVSNIRILARDTIDLAVRDAIEMKAENQDGLKVALAKYRIKNRPESINFY